MWGVEWSYGHNRGAGMATATLQCFRPHTSPGIFSHSNKLNFVDEKPILQNELIFNRHSTFWVIVIVTFCSVQCLQEKDQ